MNSQSKLVVACAQFTAENTDIEFNLKKIGGLAAEAAKGGADLVVFPELATTGYLETEAVLPLVEPIPGPTSEALAQIARDNSTALAVGMAEIDGETMYNTMLFLDADGEEIFRYRKVHLWSDEREWATPGTTFNVSRWKSVPVGMWICYDSRFPEAARSLAIGGARLAVVATAWMGPISEWELAIRSRAMDNGIFVAASALQGDDYIGGSIIVDPHGEVLALADENCEAVIMAEIDVEVSTKFHDRVPLLDDRQPGTYQ